MDKIYDSFLGFESLTSIFEKYIHTNSAIGIDNITHLKFSDMLTREFQIIQNKVNNKTYSFTPYKEKLILKSRTSRPRQISIPTIRDKIVLKTIDLYLKELFAEIKQPLPQTIIKTIKGNIDKFDSYIKLDMSNFYNSISHGILFKILENYKENSIDDRVLFLIKNAVTTPTKNKGEKLDNDFNTRGIPQGISISNVLSSIFLLEFDKKFSEQEHFLYVRYVDDILILCKNEDLSRLKREIEYEIEGIYSLKLNENKSVFNNLENGFDFLGYFIYQKDNKSIFTVKKANKLKFEDSLVKLFSHKKHSYLMSNNQFLFLINNKVTGSISKKVTGNLEREFNYGWLFYYSQINDTEYLYHLDWLIKNLLRKFEILGVEQDQIKSFVKAFYEIKYYYDSTDYIFRPDNYSISEKKEILINIFQVPSNDISNHNQIRKWYYKLIYRPILEYEKDIKKWTY